MPQHTLPQMVHCDLHRSDLMADRWSMASGESTGSTVGPSSQSAHTCEIQIRGGNSYQAAMDLGRPPPAHLVRNLSHVISSVWGLLLGDPPGGGTYYDEDMKAGLKP